MAKIKYPSAFCIRHNELDERVSDSAEALLKTIGILDDLAKPKHFNLHNMALKQFDQLPSDESRHYVRVTCPKETPVDEIVCWQVYGDIGGRIVNVVAYHVFHTYINDRTGSGEYFINGKTDCKPERGGVTLDDIWQDNDKWKYELREVIPCGQ